MNCGMRARISFMASACRRTAAHYPRCARRTRAACRRSLLGRDVRQSRLQPPMLARGIVLPGLMVDDVVRCLAGLDHQADLRDLLYGVFIHRDRPVGLVGADLDLVVACLGGRIQRVRLAHLRIDELPGAGEIAEAQGRAVLSQRFIASQALVVHAEAGATGEQHDHRSADRSENGAAHDEPPCKRRCDCAPSRMVSCDVHLDFATNAASRVAASPFPPATAQITSMRALPRLTSASRKEWKASSRAYRAVARSSPHNGSR